MVSFVFGVKVWSQKDVLIATFCMRMILTFISTKIDLIHFNVVQYCVQLVIHMLSMPKYYDRDTKVAYNIIFNNVTAFQAYFSTQDPTT